MQDPLLYIIFLNAIIYAATTLLRKNVVDNTNIEPLEYFVIMLFVKALLIFSLFFIVDERQKKLMYPSNIFNKFKQNYKILILIKTLGMITFFFYMFVIKNSPLTKAIPLLAVTKITFTVLLSILILKEKVTPYRCIGLFLGLISIYMLK